MWVLPKTDPKKFDMFQQLQGYKEKNNYRRSQIP